MRVSPAPASRSSPAPAPGPARPIRAAGRVSRCSLPGVLDIFLAGQCCVPGLPARSAAHGLPAGKCEQVPPREAAPPRGSTRWSCRGRRSRPFHLPEEGTGTPSPQGGPAGNRPASRRSAAMGSPFPLDWARGGSAAEVPAGNRASDGAQGTQLTLPSGKRRRNRCLA